MENVDLTVLKPEDAASTIASPPEAVSCATTCTTTYWCLVGAYVIVGILMQVGNVNWARWFRPGAGAQPKVHVE